MLSATHLDPIFPTYPPPITQNVYDKIYHNYWVVASVADPECYPGSEFFHPGSRIQAQKDSGFRIRLHIKEFKFFNPENWF